MRGVPTHPVPCLLCGAQRGCAKDQLCHSCRVTRVSSARRRHVWTGELDERLRRTYRASADRAALIQGLSQFQRMCGFPRSVILSRAADLGLTARRGRPWNSQELAVLHDTAGTRPISALARRLRRSYYSVQGQLSRSQLRGRFSDGYSQQDLELLLGVSSRRVRRWIELKWLKPRDGRIAEVEVSRFLRRHPEEYQLSRVDEAWFKGLLFPCFNSAFARDPISDAAQRGSCALPSTDNRNEVLQ